MIKCNYCNQLRDEDIITRFSTGEFICDYCRADGEEMSEPELPELQDED